MSNSSDPLFLNNLREKNIYLTDDTFKYKIIFYLQEKVHQHKNNLFDI